MGMIPSNAPLPQPFFSISQMTSVEQKTKLGEVITSLHHLMKEYEQIEPPVSTVALVDRYFDYLIKSCQSIPVLNRRGRWLLGYGEIVRDHLLILQARRFRRSEDLQREANESLFGHLIEMANALAGYGTVVSSSVETKDAIATLLECIIPIGNSVYKDPEDFVYLALVDRIVNFTEEVSGLYRCGSEAENEHMTILLPLHGIYKSLNRIVLRQQSTLH